jgi:hypothetical protein
MPPTQLINAGIEGPLTDDFNFDAHIVVPPAKDQYELPLAIRIAENLNIENFNNNSILDTVNAKTTISPRPDDLDIGPDLKTPFCYSSRELQDLVDSQRYCDSFGPLPPSLTREVEVVRANVKKVAELERQAEKDKDKEAETKTRASLLGSMRLVNPTPRVMGKSELPVIPTVYLLGIKNKACPPLNFFLNDHIKTVNHSPQDVHVKLSRPWGADDTTSEKIPLLDMPKMVSLWGSDGHHSCLTPLRYIEASANFLQALQLLCSSNEGQEPTSTSYALEFKQHRDFFIQQVDFESSFQLWYSFELESCRDIMKGVLFDWTVYALHVEVLVRAREIMSNSASSFSGVKRPADVDTRLSKGPRYPSSVDISSTRASFRNTTPACLLCGRDHRYRDHPSSSTSFEDGKPLFCRYTDAVLWTVKPFKGPSSKRICTVWNISKSCDGRHGADCIHFCSLCGGDHTALERNTRCSRVTDGRIRV